MVQDIVVLGYAAVQGGIADNHDTECPDAGCEYTLEPIDEGPNFVCLCSVSDPMQDESRTSHFRCCFETSITDADAWLSLLYRLLFECLIYPGVSTELLKTRPRIVIIRPR
jgi:hypothetical protein